MLLIPFEKPEVVNPRWWPPTGRTFQLVNISQKIPMSIAMHSRLGKSVELKCITNLVHGSRISKMTAIKLGSTHVAA